MLDLNDKVSGNSLTAAEWNQVPSEIQNVIESLGISLSGADLEQLGKAIAGYVANGDFYTDSGVSDAYVLTPVGLKKSPPAYTDGSRIRFYAGNSNTGASTVNVGGLGVVSIKTSLDTDLPALSITAGGLYEAVYYATGGWYRLMEVSASVAPEIHSLTASVAANALTISLPPQFIEFRSTTLTDGAPVRREIGSTISMTVSSGSTLGTVNAVQARLAVLAIDNAGTVEVAVVNTMGGTPLTENGLITTVAEGGAGAADSNTVIYSTTARANVAYRVMGYIDITEATAGTWATAPTLVQGSGGNAMRSQDSIGYGQTWQAVSRTSGTTYYNTTGRPIIYQVDFSGVSNTQPQALANINGSGNFAFARGSNTTAPFCAGNVMIPAGASYVITRQNVLTLGSEMELR